VKHGTMTEKSEAYSVRTFARIFRLSRAALINDDLGAFASAIRLMADAAAETEGNEIANMLLQGGGDGPTLIDGTRLFATARGNKAGAGSAITVENLGLAAAAMRKQLGLDGLNPINATPRYLVVGADREMVAKQVVSAIMVPSTTSNVNPFAGQLEVVVDARLTGNSWRLLADHLRFPVLELAHLEERTAPVVEQFEEAAFLGVSFRAIYDFGPGVVDWRGSYLNPGA